jgi:hypothetical protein
MRLLHARTHVLRAPIARYVVKALLKGAARGAILKSLSAVRQVWNGASKAGNNGRPLLGRRDTNRCATTALWRNERCARQWRRQHRAGRAPCHSDVMSCMLMCGGHSRYLCRSRTRRSFRCFGAMMNGTVLGHHDRVGIAGITLRGGVPGRDEKEDEDRRKRAEEAHVHDLRWLGCTSSITLRPDRRSPN